MWLSDKSLYLSSKTKLMLTIIVHIALAILLFFLVNWIGKHSISIGYIEITIFSQNEDSPAFNFLIRVLSPQVFLIVVASILYGFNADYLVKDIYLVNVYYIAFRLLASIALGRLLLLNWYKQILYWIAIISLSYVLYIKVIQYKKNILPDLSTLSNELWIVILVFIYQVMNNLDFSSAKAAERQEKYIHKNYDFLKKKYGSIIHSITQNEALDIIVYAILIYEDFNRPRIVRWIEYVAFFLSTKPKTLGIMQFRTNNYIGDSESVRLGTQKIFNKFQSLKQSAQWSLYENDYQVARDIIADYNGGESYTNEAINLMHNVQRMFYPNTTDELLV